VQVGPDWTWVKSRMRTPFSACVMCFLQLEKRCPHIRNRGHPVVSAGRLFFVSLLSVLTQPPPLPAAGSSDRSGMPAERF
jgi:hypothetical protein